MDERDDVELCVDRTGEPRRGTLCRVVGASLSSFYAWLLFRKSPVEVSPPYPIKNGIKPFYGVKASGILYRLE